VTDGVHSIASLTSPTRVTVLTVLVAYAVAGAATTEAGADSRLLDRTFVCKVGDPSTSGYPDPIPATRRHIGLAIAPESESRSPWRKAPVPAHILMVDNEGHQTREKLLISQGLDGVVKIDNVRYAAPSTIRLDRKTCRPVTDTPIPLSPRGLRVWPGKQVEDGAECRVPARIVLRVRAILRRPASLIARRGEYGLTGMPPLVGGDYVATRTSGNRNLLRVELAVATSPAAKPIAYAHIARNGTARLSVSSACGRG
jgi:hypothetical protein